MDNITTNAPRFATAEQATISIMEMAKPFLAEMMQKNLPNRAHGLSAVFVLAKDSLGVIIHQAPAGVVILLRNALDDDPSKCVKMVAHKAQCEGCIEEMQKELADGETYIGTVSLSLLKSATFRDDGISDEAMAEMTKLVESGKVNMVTSLAAVLTEVGVEKPRAWGMFRDPDGDIVIVQEPMLRDAIFSDDVPAVASTRSGTVVESTEAIAAPIGFSGQSITLH